MDNAMKKKIPNRGMRKQKYIDSHVQGALCRRIFVHWCAFFTVSMLAIGGVQVLLGNPGESLTQRISEQFGQLFFFGLVLVSLLPAFMLDTVRFSNRFVGPFARLRRCMRELAQFDNTEVVQFRDDDFWSDAAREFNALREKYLAYKQLCDANRLTIENATPAAATAKIGV
jgi:hypothetical protein